VVASRIGTPTDTTDVTPATASIMELAKSPGESDVGDPTYNRMTYNVLLSSCLIFLAMVFDAVDGHVARMAKQETNFGAELDSLCDLVSFGVAPAFLMVKMCPGFAREHQNIVWIIAATFAVCAVLRLARFNVETTEEDDHLWFVGLPTPAAAAAIAGFSLLFYNLRSAKTPKVVMDEWMQWVLPTFAFVLSLLMVSRIPYPHAINQFFRGQRSFAHVVAIVFALIPVLVTPENSIPLLVALYVLAAPVVVFYQIASVEVGKRTPGLKRFFGKR
jgi:CDP-diacylglycerol--serine O-phosphatidyltransferase